MKTKKDILEHMERTRIHSTMDEMYFSWLLDEVHENTDDYEIKGPTFYRLLYKLYCTPFEFVLRNDENRYEDGRALRTIYARIFAQKRGRSTSVYPGDIMTPVNVLEVLVALAYRMDYNISDRYVEEVREYFWLMMENLDLVCYDDANYTSNNGSFEIAKNLSTWMNRTYARNGRGGLFPLENPEKDQRKVEIWYQMHEYFKDET